MSRRSVLLSAMLAASLLAPAPAMARDNGLHQISEKLSDPRLQHSLAAALAALSEAMLDMKMAPFAQAMDQMGNIGGDKHRTRHIDPDMTLRDMAGADAAHLPQEIDRRLPQMMGAMAGMSHAMEGMLPQLEAMAGRMKNVLPAD